MFSDPVSFNGGTRFEVIAVLANCGMDTDRARRALVTWIRHKQSKGRSTEHILAKLRDIEAKFIQDTSLHTAFRDARAETFLPRSLGLPLPSHIRRASENRQILDISAGNSNIGRRTSLPQNIPHAPPSRSPRIQIPRHRSQQPDADSPITSSPEESGLRHRFMSDPMGSSHFHGLLTPPSTSPPEFPLSPLSPKRQNHFPSRRHFTDSVRTSSSGDSLFYPKYHHMLSNLRRVTPPRTSPPGAPLPPIPRDTDVLHIEQPPTPIWFSPSVYTSTPVRPLPMQPIPSPVPSLDEVEHMSTIDRDSTGHYWVDTNSECLPSEDVVRQDSPVFMFHNDRTISSSMSDPPPYVDQPDAPFPLDVPALGESLDRVLNACDGSPEVRVEVAKCVGFELGYEPPYWQARLLAAGLDIDRAKRVVDEMCRQVDWSTFFGVAM